jgi:hypothetical protein
MFMPKEVRNIAEKVFEMEPEADPSYNGRLPGTVGLTGFVREFTFWRMIEVNEGSRPEKGWLRNWPGKGVEIKAIYERWTAIHNGLGANWTEKKGYEDIRPLVGVTK